LKLKGSIFYSNKLLIIRAAEDSFNQLSLQNTQMQQDLEQQQSEINRLQSAHATAISMESAIASLQFEIQQERNRHIQQIEELQVEKR
jgi:hypothetical protein